MADPAPGRTYTQEEVNEILKRALRQQSLRGSQLSHAELVEMANEVGIDRDSLEAATADLAQSRASELVQSTEARELAEERARGFTRFVSSLFTYLIVGAMLYFIALKTGGNWFFWPIFVFAIVLAFQLRAIFFPHEGLERRRRRELREARRRERREAKDAMRRRMRASFGGPSAQALDHGAKEFETAVQAGVAALLTVAAKKIQTHAERAHAARADIEGRVDVSRRSRT
jgi:hypothetical protein